MSEQTNNDWLEKLNWDDNGLLPAIAQEQGSSKVLCLAWMNREALALTVKEQRAIYWSRSRQKLWRKGEESGHVQQLREIRVDCDLDVILLSVIQDGDIACHTGRHSCFYLKLENQDWLAVDPVLKDPALIYRK
ncbi:MAG: phosphoribosyl-AMP cyclohydrolase [Gammaproteobacteria bacterium]|nr:phosphoribosyl-AMP cyclohydrolase [Gammaproteobacteria bacterium]